LLDNLNHTYDFKNFYDKFNFVLSINKYIYKTLNINLIGEII